MIRLFRLRDRLKGLGRGNHDIGRVHVIGAGVMGGDIAAWVALADSVGLDVCLAVANEIGPHLSIPSGVPDLLRAKVSQGWLGKKTGRGYSH
ncbi:MAG: hypothetical protein WBG92_07920 [Thiohalocapsa sp.]